MGDWVTMAEPTTTTTRRAAHCSKHAFAPLAQFRPRNAVTLNVTLPAQRHQTGLYRAGLASDSPEAGDDPVNSSDPLGLAASSWWRDIVDIPQDAAYLQYWGTYEAVGHLNSLASDCGPVSSVCSVATHVATAPLVLPEAIGLGEDTLGNLAKGETIWQEGYPNQPLLGNEVIPNLSVCGQTIIPGFNGPKVSKQLGFPGMDFPGLNHNHTINFAW